MEFRQDFSKDPMEEAPKCGYIETTWLTLGCIRGCNFATNLQPILLHDLVIETQKNKNKNKKNMHTTLDMISLIELVHIFGFVLGSKTKETGQIWVIVLVENI